MTEQRGGAVAHAASRLIDDAYMTWFAAESRCEQRLRAWLDGPADDRTVAYDSYRAALDREEVAAHELQRRFESASRSPGCS